uniref:Maturase K n=1 Tax=Knipowitschia caucasica TaxID=637954 RepID=A0AAV2MEG7_KNICA
MKDLSISLTQFPIEIVAHYPRFIDLLCLIDIEFGKLFPGKQDNFLCKWEAQFVPKLLKLSTMEKKGMPDSEETSESRSFQALQSLSTFLPPTASGRGKGWTKCSVKSAMSYILDLKPSGTSILSEIP